MFLSLSPKIHHRFNKLSSEVHCFTMLSSETHHGFIWYVIIDSSLFYHVIILVFNVTYYHRILLVFPCYHPLPCKLIINNSACAILLTTLSLSLRDKSLRGAAAVTKTRGVVPTSHTTNPTPHCYNQKWP